MPEDNAGEPVRYTPPARSPTPESMPLDVCLASPIFHPEYSGGANRFRRYAPGLDSRGIRLSVMAATVGSWKAYRTFAAGNRTPDGSVVEAVDQNVHRVPMPERGDVWQTTAVLRNAAMLRNKWIFESAVLARCRDASTRPDLVIWRYPLSTTSVRALVALRGMGVPTIRVVTMFGGPGGRGWKKRIKRLSFPVPFNYLDGVVVSSDVMRRDLERLGVKTRIEVIPHGVDVGRFHPLPAGPGAAPVRTRLGLSADHELVLFVGPINERKGLDHLAAAWDRVAQERPRAHLVLVGPEPAGDGTGHGQNGTFAEKIRVELKSGCGANRVVFVGPVSDVEEYMKAADIFVFPSRREGMPNVVLEAFASGVPCVMTAFAGLSRDFGRPGDQFVLVDRDATHLAEAIASLLEDGDRRRELGLAARRWAMEHLDLEKSLDRLAAVCRDMVESGGTSGVR